MRLLTGALFLRTSEETEIPLIWSTATVPEKQPLHSLALVKFVFEPKTVVLVKLIQEIEELCRSLHDGERGRASIVHNDGNST